MTMDLAALYPKQRLSTVADAVREAGLSALLLTPGPDLRYVTGYDAKQLERLTCLAVPAEGEPFHNPQIAPGSIHIANRGPGEQYEYEAREVIDAGFLALDGARLRATDAGRQRLNAVLAALLG